jgi:hypothetical protein
MTYLDYLSKMQSLLEQGKSSTTDNGDKPNLIHYTQLNLQRMHRLGKTISLLKQVEEGLKTIKKPMTWLVITEGASQIKLKSKANQLCLPHLQRDTTFLEETEKRSFATQFKELISDNSKNIEVKQKASGQFKTGQFCHPFCY